MAVVIVERKSEPHSPLAERQNCKHCGEVCPDANSDFCCYGCEGVYNFINSCDLSAYYSLKNEKGFKASEPTKENPFKDFEHSELKQKYLNKQKNSIELKIFVEGIHCAACLWILEKIPDLVNAVQFAKLDMSKSLLSLKVEEQVKISEVLFLIQKLGYKPRPLRLDEDSYEYIAKEKRKAITKIGVTAFITGNIMLMTTSIYGGVEGKYLNLFHQISFFLSLGIVFYSATEFYKSSIRAIKQRSFSLDYSLSIAVVFGFLISSFNLIAGSEAVYFDSIAGLTFLILSSRYLLKYAQWESSSRPTSANPLSPKLVSKEIENTEVQVLPESILAGDIVWVETNDRIACDSVLLSDKAWIDESVLTGENEPVVKSVKSSILAGTKNLGSRIRILIEKKQTDSYVFELIKNSQGTDKLESVENAKAYAKALSIFSHTAAFVALFYFSWLGLYSRAFDTALSILIISCPCAFAIATPLSLRKAMDRLKDWGVITKNAKAIEHLANIKNIFFDKTGTLTYSDFRLTNLEIKSSELNRDEILNLLFQLEKDSKHPIAQSICSYVKKQVPRITRDELIRPTEELGKGVSYNSKKYGQLEIKSLDDQAKNEKQIALWQNQNAIVILSLSNQVRPESYDIIKKLSKKYKTHLLSGDNQQEVNRISSLLPFSGSIYFEKSPIEKESIVYQTKDSLMVGDGVNDSLAFKSAKVGIATQGSLELAFEASDLYLDNCRLSKLPAILKLAKTFRKNIYSNYILSMIFNLFFISAAFAGMISPLSAAIIMPISSFALSIKSLWSLRNRGGIK